MEELIEILDKQVEKENKSYSMKANELSNKIEEWSKNSSVNTHYLDKQINNKQTDEEMDENGCIYFDKINEIANIICKNFNNISAEISNYDKYKIPLYKYKSFIRKHIDNCVNETLCTLFDITDSVCFESQFSNFDFEDMKGEVDVQIDTNHCRFELIYECEKLINIRNFIYLEEKFCEEERISNATLTELRKQNPNKVRSINSDVFTVKELEIIEDFD